MGVNISGKGVLSGLATLVTGVITNLATRIIGYTSIPGTGGSSYYTTIVDGVEVQISIGDQGSGGAEILAPVDVYTVPTGKTTYIQKVEIFNTTNFTHRYDLAVLDPGVALTDQNALVNDGWLSPSTLVTNTDITQTLTAGQRIVVFPSTVDVAEVKVYGIETSI